MPGAAQLVFGGDGLRAVFPILNDGLLVAAAGLIKIGFLIAPPQTGRSQAETQDRCVEPFHDAVFAGGGGVESKSSSGMWQ